MKTRQQIVRLKALDHGMLVRVRTIPLDESDQDIKVNGQSIFHDIEEVVQEPWKSGDTPEIYVARVLGKSDWKARAETYLTKVLRANGLLKPRFEGVPEVSNPTDLP